MAGKKALILGATGLVGGALLTRLLACGRYEVLRVIARRPVDDLDRRLEQHIIDFERMEEHAALFAVDDLFCCLGTTIAAAKTKQQFRRVDYDYPLRAARLAHAAGASRCLVVTALGASSRSLAFYNRVKGDLERDLAALGFPALHIFRPSLLLGPRAERRPLENFLNRHAAAVSALMAGPLRKYRPISATAVAAAMEKAAAATPAGLMFHESDEMQNG